MRHLVFSRAERGDEPDKRWIFALLLCLLCLLAPSARRCGGRVRRAPGAARSAWRCASCGRPGPMARACESGERGRVARFPFGCDGAGARGLAGRSRESGRPTLGRESGGAREGSREGGRRVLRACVTACGACAWPEIARCGRREEKVARIKFEGGMSGPKWSGGRADWRGRGN